jgi:hypothetical protein
MLAVANRPDDREGFAATDMGSRSCVFNHFRHLGDLLVGG